MSSALHALGRWAYRARWLVVLLWVGVLAVLFTLAALLGTGTNNTYAFPGTQSQDALDSLARTFPQFSGTSAQLIAVAPEGGDVTDPDFESAVDDAITALGQVPQVSANLVPTGPGHSLLLAGLGVGSGWGDLVALVVYAAIGVALVVLGVSRHRTDAG